MASRSKSYGQLQDLLVALADKPLQVTVVREPAQDARRQETTIAVPANPMKQFGLAMSMGPIAAVQVDSPAAKADIQPGDLLKTVDGKSVEDPMRLPDLFRSKAGKEVVLGLERDGKPLEKKVALSEPQECEPTLPDSPAGISELGAAYFVLNTVIAIEPKGPADKIGMRPGDKLLSVRIVPPSAEQLEEIRKKAHSPDLTQTEFELPFGDEERNWPCFMLAVQDFLPGTTVEFSWQRGDKKMTGTAAPAPASNWFNPQRGWFLELKKVVQRADGLGQAVRMGWHETADSTLLVYRSLHSVGTGKISARMVAGPWGILKQALLIARLGFGNFLVFLTLLSANLAVINFLPIPVLDGGHMALLIYEGIRGKPADERVQEVMTWIGLILILALMVWAFGLDLNFFSRPGRTERPCSSGRARLLSGHTGRQETERVVIRSFAARKAEGGGRRVGVDGTVGFCSLTGTRHSSRSGVMMVAVGFNPRSRFRTRTLRRVATT